MRDYQKIRTNAEQDAILESLWDEFADVPMDPDTECIEDGFLDFPAGTHKEDVWHWFDERYSKGIAYLLYGDTEDFVSESRRLYGLKKFCFECETRDCAYNKDGECRYALVHESKPAFTDEDGCISGVINL